jgi:squalene synthase HpnC
MGVDHYENFPVASILVPARLRAAVREIYRFARTADDIADEGDAPAAARLAALAGLREQLDRIEAGSYPDAGAWSALAAAVARHRLPVERLRELLHAFEQDARGTDYADDERLLEYCRYSANPVGRLLLALYGREEPQLGAWSDAICTGLQLVNFWQDIERDHQRGRVYIPRSSFARFGVDPGQIARRRIDESWTRMILDRTQFARARLLAGRPLARALGGRIGWELRLVVEGGLRIAERIDAARGDVFDRRPVLRAADWARMCARAARWP